jgi:hypothetical protein
MTKWTTATAPGCRPYVTFSAKPWQQVDEPLFDKEACQRVGRMIGGPRAAGAIGLRGVARVT